MQLGTIKMMRTNQLTPSPENEYIESFHNAAFQRGRGKGPAMLHLRGRDSKMPPKESWNMPKGIFTISTTRRMEFVDITPKVEKAIAESAGKSELCCLFNPHTTAGLTINEGADPAVQADIISVLRTVIPQNHPYKHMEGNSPAHIMASLMGSSVTVFMEAGRLQLGTWQRIFFCEFDGPRTRKVYWRLI